MDFDYGLLAKYIIDELSPEELGEVMKWRKLSDENKTLFSYLVRLRISWNYKKYNQEVQIDKALAKINARIERTKRYRYVRGFLKYAAIVTLFLSVVYGGYEYFRPEKFVTIAVKPGGEIKKVTLADGTTVWLKEASSLKIPESFSKGKRDLSMQGEIFFDVAENKIPFNISTGYLHVSVLGTAFDVKVNDVDKVVETTLVRGKIALLDQDLNTVLDMLPGEKVTYNWEDNQYTSEYVDANLCATWRLKQHIFEEATIREIADTLTSLYGVKIHIISSELAKRKYRCVINKDDDLESALEQLNFIAPLKYRMENKELFIYESKK